MYKIAHISDSHISFSDENGYGKRLVDLLKDLESRNCNHVIITGDIVDNPFKEDFQYVREIFSHFNLLDASKLTVVPGNHDIYGGTPKGQNCFRFYMNCKNYDFEKNVDDFIQTFKETFPSNHSFPFLKTINNMAFIGLNTLFQWSFKKNREGSNGYIDEDAYKKLIAILSSEEVKDKYKFVLLHHHVNKSGANKERYPEHSLWLKAINWKMKMYGKKKLLDILKRYRVNLILSGHTHVNEIYNIKGLTVVNSSASIMPLTDDQKQMFNIISVPEENESDRNITVETITIEK